MCSTQPRHPTSFSEPGGRFCTRKHPGMKPGGFIGRFGLHVHHFAYFGGQGNQPELICFFCDPLLYYRNYKMFEKMGSQLDASDR